MTPEGYERALAGNKNCMPNVSIGERLLAIDGHERATR